MNAFPKFLVAIDMKRSRIFVLAQPNISATLIDDEWQFTDPISDEEIMQHYEIVADLEKASRIVEEAKTALLPNYTSKKPN